MPGWRRSTAPAGRSAMRAPRAAGLHYTGYVAPPDMPSATEMSDEIVVSAGGGAAGIALLRTALAARRAGCLAHHPWRLIAGMHLPEADFAVLQEGLPPAVVVE